MIQVLSATVLVLIGLGLVVSGLGLGLELCGLVNITVWNQKVNLMTHWNASLTGSFNH